MNLRFVEAFVWVARLKSITRGAEKLCLTQSAVSNRIAALEEELGILLLDRRDRGFRLTSAGVRFLQYADRFLALQRELKNELGTPEQLPLSLRIGGIEAVLHTWLIPMVYALKKASPHIEFELTIEMTHVLNEQIRRGGLDLIFSAMPATGDGIVNESLALLDMVFVGPESMAALPALGLDDILEYEIMTFQRGSQPHVALMELLRAAGAGSKRVHTISSISAQAHLVESGFGIATLPRSAAQQLAQRHRIAILESTAMLTPLPLVASYWTSPGSPVLDHVLNSALDFARIHAIDSAPQSD